MFEAKIARTGRVQTWMDVPTSRLPVYCSVFVVDDSMEGPYGIEASWRFVSHALRYGAGVAVHLSKLRGRGTENGKGLVASGPVSFGKIYSCLNQQLRRGGVYKNGAVVLHLDLNHPDIVEFIECPRSEIPWAKRCINVTQQWWDDTDSATRELILDGIRKGDIWLVKVKHDADGNRVYGNVCLEVFLKSRGTCLLEHINLGACDVHEIPHAMIEGMNELIQLHAKTGVEQTGEYLSQEEDRQVGLGLLGLANLLALEGVTYRQFADALEGSILTPAATNIVKSLSTGIKSAAAVAKAANMDRAFAIAPTASCSYRYTDRAGYTTAPELAPPIGRKVDRDSSTFGVQTYDYGDVETAEEVGWDVYTRVTNGIMKLLEDTGLLHGYSFNTWSDVVVYSDQFIQEWLDSPQTSMYYSLQVMEGTQAKDDAMAALDGNFEDLFDFSDITSDTDKVPDFCVSCAE